MAAALAARHLDRRRLTDVAVASAGLLPGGQPATAETVATLKEWELDLSRHESRQLSPALVAQADLVLVMTVQQVIEVTAAERNVWSKTFTLVEAVARAERPGGPRPRQDAGAWVAWLHAGRSAGSLLRSRSSDDIPDPFGQSSRVYAQTRDRLDDLVGRLIDRVGA